MTVAWIVLFEAMVALWPGLLAGMAEGPGIDLRLPIYLAALLGSILVVTVSQFVLHNRNEFKLFRSQYVLIEQRWLLSGLKATQALLVAGLFAAFLIARGQMAVLSELDYGFPAERVGLIEFRTENTVNIRQVVASMRQSPYVEAASFGSSRLPASNMLHMVTPENVDLPISDNPNSMLAGH